MNVIASRKVESVSRAFTLVELLTVIAVIGLLVSMLIPALNKARARAKTVSCGTHLRQLGIANELYLNEKRSLPGHRWKLTNGEDARWPNAISEYLKSDELMVCPMVADWLVGRDNSYGYNYKYLGSLRRCSESVTAPYERFPVRRVAAPSQTIAYADCDGTGWTLPYLGSTSTREAGSEDRSPDRLGHHGYTLDPTYIPAFSVHTVNEEGEPDPYAFRTRRSYISNRHDAGSNAVFVDGHVSPITPGEVYRDNRFWNGLGREDARLDPHLDVRTEDGAFRYQKEIDERG